MGVAAALYSRLPEFILLSSDEKLNNHIQNL